MKTKATPRKELYPVIINIINNRFRQTKIWVSREEIIFELLNRQESVSTIEHNWKRNLAAIEAGKRYQEWETTLEGYTGNWVDWFSARFDHEGYGREFKRERDSNSNWSYKPK
jgi:hypothetical protein